LPRIIKPPLPSRTLAFARQLRQQGTDAENRWWYHLRAKRFLDSKWRRQHLLSPDVVDFYCLAMRLVVELDGGQHSVQQDACRTASLEAQDLLVLRFWNDHVLKETEAVLEAIFRVMRERTLSPAALPMGEGNNGARSR